MIIFFGPAGAGKSVQGQLLAERRDWHWISSGQILRDTKNKEILKSLKEGELVVDDKVDQLIIEALNDISDDDKVVIDGFPREIEQAYWLMDNYSTNGKSIDLIIVLDVPKEELLKRLQIRNRADDTFESINERLRIYNAELDPMLDYFHKKGVQIIHIDGLGTIDQVHNKIITELEKCNIL